MKVFFRIAIGLFLVAHGLVHLLYLVAKEDDPSWPFTLKKSWLLPEAARRPTALVLLTFVVTAFALLGLAVWGLPGLSAVWPQLAIAAAALSLALLVAFWDRHLWAGVAIDAVVVAAALVHPTWIDEAIG